MRPLTARYEFAAKPQDMGSVSSFEQWVWKSAVACTEGWEIRYGLFGLAALSHVAELPRLRWIRQKGSLPPQASYQSIMARQERAVAVIAALLRLHGRRVIDREIILSSRLCDLLILISRTVAPPGTETGGRSNW